MDWGPVVVAGITGIAAVAKVVLDRSHVGGTRSRIRRDLDLLERMPDGDAKIALGDFIDRRVLALVEDEQTKSRDASGIVLAVLFLALAAWMSAQALSSDGFSTWWVFAVPLGLLGFVGLSQDAIPRERDERGRPRRSTKAS